MNLIGKPLQKQRMTKEDYYAIQQPVSKDGYSNELFNKLYGKDKNPCTGTERDRSKRKKVFFLGEK